jgi:NADP-reducing hydrogenase subunit HndB
VEKLTVETLRELNKKLKAGSRVESAGKKIKITVHMGTCGLASGAQKVYDQIVALIKENNMVNIAITTGEELNSPDNPSDMILTTSGCAGMCCNEPMMSVKLANRPSVLYQKLNEKKVAKIFEEHIKGGNVVHSYALGAGPEAVY